MTSDFEPIFREVEGRNVSVYPIADVHLGSAECDLDGFSSFLRRVQSDPDAFVVLAGDLVDTAVTGSPSNIYAPMTPHEQIEQAVELLRPLAKSEKILAIVSGNHELRTKRLSDINAMEVIACKLDLTHAYRENMAFLRVKLAKNGMSDTYNMLIMHGASAAKKRKMHVEGVDVFITGHTHDPIIEKPARIVFTQKGRVAIKPTLHVTATSWLNYGGYGAAKMYAPRATSDPQRITLEFAGTNRFCGSVGISW